MSFNLVVKVWNVPIKGTHKLVLLALADYAAGKNYPERNVRKGECFPGIDALANKCGLSKHTIIRSIAYLEGMGLIRHYRRFNSSNYYCLEEGKLEWFAEKRT